MEPWVAAKESFKLVWRCHQLPSEFLAQCHLPRASRQSHLSANDWVIMKWSRELCTDLLAFALRLKENPGKPQLWDRWWRDSGTSHRFKWGPFPLNEVGRIYFCNLLTYTDNVPYIFVSMEIYSELLYDSNLEIILVTYIITITFTVKWNII